MTEFEGNVDILKANLPNMSPGRKVTIKLIGGEDGQQSATAAGGIINVGGNGSEGTINFFPKKEFDPYGAIELNNKKIDEISTIRLLGDTGSIRLVRNLSPQEQYITGGCDLSPAGLKLFTERSNFQSNRASIYADGMKGMLWIGGNGTIGEVYMFPDKRTDIDYPLWFESDYTKSNPHPPSDYSTIVFRAKAGLDNASIRIGGRGKNGHLELQPAKGFIQGDIRVPQPTIEFFADFARSARCQIGGYDYSGQLYIYSRSGRGYTGDNPSIILDGERGDINLVNADCAEEFDVGDIDSRTVEPGMVMVLDEDAKLQISHMAYDKRVAGVVSGEGNLKPAIVLNKKASTQSKRIPLALMGRVNCKVDADFSPIGIGDMLTTSTTEGHAMKATKRSKSFGSIIGKALKGIKSGKSCIPILVALQ